MLPLTWADLRHSAVPAQAFVGCIINERRNCPGCSNRTAGIFFCRGNAQDLSYFPQEGMMGDYPVMPVKICLIPDA